MSEDNQWGYLREQIDEHLTKARSLLDANFEGWINASDATAMLSAANYFSPENASSSLRSYFKTIEKWYQEQHNAVIKKSAKEVGINPNQWLLGTGQWVEQALNADVRSLVRAFKDYKVAITEAAEFMDRNSGVTGLLSNVLRGYLNPIDGIACFFGESSLDKEQKAVQQRLTVAANSVEESIVSVIESIDNIIITRWNQETITAINMIYSVQDGGQPPRISENNGAIANNNSLIMFLLAGLVAGILVLVGMVILKKIGVI